MPLFERVRYVRNEVLDLTQRDFADLIGVNLRTVKGWEHPLSPRGAPDEVNARRLAHLAGGVSHEIFMTPQPLEETQAQEILRKLDLILAHLGIKETK
jgi:transcriptional regulator with XRE-family HTH domain